MGPKEKAASNKQLAEQAAQLKAQEANEKKVTAQWKG
jgi:hypothetical protein